MELIVVFILVLFTGVVAAQDSDDMGDPVLFTTPLALTVHVTDPDGQDIVGAPVQAYTSHGIDFGITNASGVVVLELEYAPGLDHVAVVHLSDGSWHAGYTLEERHSFDQKFRSLISCFAFQSEYQVSLHDQVEQYSLSIQAGDAVKISGLFIGAATAMPVAGLAGRAFPYLSAFLTDDGGGFDLAVEKHEPFDFVYQLPDTHQLYVQSLTASQTSADIDLGQISVQSLPENAQVSITFTNHQDDPVDPDTLRLKHAHVTLVEENSQYMLMYSTNRDRTTAVDNSWSVDEPTPRGPSGTYYVAAGMYGSDEVVALWRAVRDGRKALLDAQGVVKVVLVDGQLERVEFDSVQNGNAVLRVGSDFLD